MYTKESDELYDEMCHIVGEAVLVLAEGNIETKRIVIADVLRTALANRREHSEKRRWALETAIKLLDDTKKARSGRAMERRSGTDQSI